MATDGKEADEQCAALEAKKQLLLSDIDNLHASKQALEEKVARLRGNAAYLLEHTSDGFPEIKVNMDSLKRDRKTGEQMIGSRRIRLISPSEIETFMDRESWSTTLPDSSVQQRHGVPQSAAASSSQNETGFNLQGNLTFSLPPVSSLAQDPTPTPKRQLPGKCYPSSSVSHRHYPTYEMEKTVECCIYGHPDSHMLFYDYVDRSHKTFAEGGPAASFLVKRDIETWEKGLQLFEDGNKKAERVSKEGAKPWSCLNDQYCLPRFCLGQNPGRTPSPDGPCQKEACRSCVAANRLCFVRKMPAAEHKIVMLPLPEMNRRDVNDDETGILDDPYRLRYWVKDLKAFRKRLKI